MCGIVGITGDIPVAPLIYDALKRLEYRGYDSAGIATIEHGELDRRRAEGKLVNLEKLLIAEPLQGYVGIGHTRWATHGVPNEENAHPHFSDGVAIVHNGIIENFLTLKNELLALGAQFESETDTEVVAHLIAHRQKQYSCSPQEAVKAVLSKLEGAFSIVVIFEDDEEIMIGARRGPPLAIGHGDGMMLFGSDAIALAPFTNKITYLDDGDWAILSPTKATIFDANNRYVERAMQTSVASSLMVDKGNYRHFMLKEIHEQPEVVGHALARYLDFARGEARLPETLSVDWTKVNRITITACGTAYLAGLVGKYWFERYAQTLVDIDVASEFRYRGQSLAKGGLSIVVSQSGETADTLASQRKMKSMGQQVAAIVNVTESTIAREADFVLPILAGQEIGVASTKAFTCQLAVLASLAIAAGRARGVTTKEDEHELVQAMSEVPGLISKVLRKFDEVKEILPILNGSKHMLYIGRDTNYPLSLEGALKLKEISYIHAEGYAAGELKHGPIALVDKHMPVVVIAPYDHVFDKVASNMQEVSARGGRIILLTDEKGAAATNVKTAKTIVLPNMHPMATPLVYVVLLQILAYLKAIEEGTDVDQPRNLAKSVTVE